MKQKIIKISILLIVFSAIFAYFAPKSVAYASNKTAEEELDDTVENSVNKLDTDALQKYFDSLTDDETALFNDDVKTLLKGLINGENSLDFQTVVSLIFKRLLATFAGFLPAVISVIIISILYGMLSGLNSGFLNESTNKVVHFACYGAALVILLNEVVSMINVAVTAADKLSGLMQAVFPLMLTVMTALGGVTTVGFTKPLMAVAATFVISFIKVLVIPCFAASVILAVIGNLSPMVKLDKLSVLFRKIAEWSLIFVFGLFLTLLTAKGIIGRTADGVAVNAAKFALSSYVPILGGYISDGFDVVMASCILVKNALGAAGLIVMLSIMLAPIVKLVAFAVALKFAAAVTEPVGGGRISDLLNGVSKSAGLLIASICGLCFMFFAVVMLVVSSCNLGVV